MKKSVSMIVVLFLCLVAALHVIRLLFQIEVIVGEVQVPQWASIIGFIVPAGLALLLKRETSK